MAPRILRVGLPDRYVTHGAPALLHEEVGFTAERIAERVEAAVLDPRACACRTPRGTFLVERRFRFLRKPPRKDIFPEGDAWDSGRGTCHGWHAPPRGIGIPAIA